MLLFIISILSFVWRTGSVSDPEQRTPLSPNGALGARIAVTTVFALGMFFMLMIVRTLKRYGTHEEHNYFGIGVRRTPGSRRSEAGTGVRGREDMEAAMERRGRGRERDVLSGRRQEAGPEVMSDKETSGDVVGREKGGLRAMLRLGHGARDLDLGLEEGFGKRSEDEKIHH